MADDNRAASGDLQPLGITHASDYGTRTVYELSGQEGLDLFAVVANGRALDPARFVGRLVSVPLEEVGFEELTLSPCVIERTPHRIRTQPSDVVRLNYVLEGYLDLETREGSFRAQAGELVVLPMTEPFRLTLSEPAKFSVIIVPVPLLKMSPSDVDVTRARVLPSSPLSESFIGILRGLSQEAPDDHTVDAELLSHALIDIAIGLVLTRGRGAEVDSEDTLMRRRVYTMIEREYASADLRVEQIAQRLRVSVRYLHRLFSSENRTITQAIRARRLEALRAELLRSEETFEAIAKQVGFGSTDAAYRGFRETTALTPSEYRRNGRSHHCE